MKNPEELRKDATRQYRNLITSGEIVNPIFPWDCSLGRVSPEEILKDRTSLRKIIESIEPHPGIELEWIKRTTRKLGVQTVPKKIVFKNLSSLLSYIGKTEEFTNFLKIKEYTIKRIPNLESWIHTNYPIVMEEENNWEDIINVTLAILNNSNLNEYHLRELPLQVHTKFIERNSKILKKILDYLLPEERINSEFGSFSERYNLKKTPERIRFRILDPNLAKTNFMSWEDIEIELDDFTNNFFHKGIQNIFIIENLTSFLSFPKIDQSICIFGKGFQVSNLRTIPWLLEKHIFYWGDLDIQGLQILSLVRGFLPMTRSFLMDIETLEAFHSLLSEGTSSGISNPENLTSEEEKAFHFLKKNQPINRLEQERIPLEHLLSILEKELLFESPGSF